MVIDKGLIQFATVRQLEYIEAIEKHGGTTLAAQALGIHHSTVGRSMEALKKRAALHGYSPEHHLTRPIAPGLRMRGTSQLYKQGQAAPVLEWIKTSADAEAQTAALRAAAEAAAEELPRLAPVAAPAGTLDHLCNLYTLTDCHIGMLAWHREGGEDWDLKIAEATLVRCFEQMVVRSPAAKVGFVNQLGDFLHYDSALAAVTPQHGNALDADGRMPKMVKTAVRILRHVIDFALARHEQVVVLLAEGNHDVSSSVWLRAMFQALYENEPRVTVIDSELPYYVHQHGQTMLAFHHGHLKKTDHLPILFAAQFPIVWGATTKRYAHTGHRHHIEEKEHSGITVHQHPTLAARDAYAARGGWIAERQVTALTYHTQFGEVARNTVTPEMAA
jgi:hypothetical protein